MIIQIDPLRVQQVIINLLQNAIKFSSEGSDINVEIGSKVEMSQNKLILEIRVIDSGIGISKEDQMNLFKPFFRSGDQANRQLNQNGHGIGLSICKKIAERLDGTITVNSKLNVGTIMTFSFSAPYTETFAYNNPFRHPKDVLKMKAEKWKKKRQA